MVIGWSLLIAVQVMFALAIITVSQGAARRSNRRFWAGIGWGALGVAGLVMGSLITPLAGLLLIVAVAAAAWWVRHRLRQLERTTTPGEAGA
jgi:hypothetical protein